MKARSLKARWITINGHFSQRIRVIMIGWPSNASEASQCYTLLIPRDSLIHAWTYGLMHVLLMTTILSISDSCRSDGSERNLRYCISYPLVVRTFCCASSEAIIRNVIWHIWHYRFAFASRSSYFFFGHASLNMARPYQCKAEPILAK